MENLEELLKKSGFEKDKNIFKKDSSIGCIEVIEYAEGKIIVPEDFSYVEKRIHMDDLMSILSINKLAKKGINKKEYVLNFFKRHKIINTRLNNNYFYVKTKADPSSRGIEAAHY